jgi:hypothetical protein
MMKMKLEQVVEAIEAASEGSRSYYDTETGKTVWVSDDPYSGEVDTELAEMIEYAPPGRFLRFPTKYEIHDYSIMESFVGSLPAGAAREDLADAIRGRGAFRRFKQSIRYHGMEQSWYDYLENAYRDIAIRWCQDNDMELEEAAPPEQLQRIARMEKLLNEANAAVSAMDQAIEDYRAAQEKIHQLRRYYEGGQWMEDFKADEDKKLPSFMARGVLAEDAIYDLLTDQVRLREELQALVKELEQ